MNTLRSKNLRIIGKYDYSTDTEESITKLETLFRVDLKSLPQWKDVIDKINNNQKEYIEKLLNAKKRRHQILKRLYIQNYRLSPFQLTDNFARTTSIWKAMKNKEKKETTPLISEYSSLSLLSDQVDNDTVAEKIDVASNGHPNSEEILQVKDQFIKQDAEVDSNLNSPNYLPATIYTNQHKKISSIGSDNVVLSYKEYKTGENNIKSESTVKFSLNQTNLVKYYPKILTINNCTINEKSINFSLLNCSTKRIHIRFKKLSDVSYFKSFTMLPLVPVKLNPGLSKNYKFKFILHDNIDINEISLKLFFITGIKTTEDMLSIPIKGKFERNATVLITETVNIPPAYLWQVNSKCGYPKGLAKIQVCGDTAYHLHIRKNNLDFIEISKYRRNSESHKVITVPESSMAKIDDDKETQDIPLYSPRKEMNALDNIKAEDEPIKSIDIATLIFNDILNLVYEPFTFKNTYLKLSPKTKRIVLVYFTKAEHVGYHQSYYEFIFYDHDKIVYTKNVKVFTEVLQHPILISPSILDTTLSPLEFGYCEDYFTIINTHSVYYANITIQTTDRMNKIFQITPKVTSIPAKSNVKFNVKLCRNKKDKSETIDLMAYFTIKIIVNGHKSVYKNVPPIYYEIITPITQEYIRNYKEKHLEDRTDTSPVTAVLND